MIGDTVHTVTQTVTATCAPVYVLVGKVMVPAGCDDGSGSFTWGDAATLTAWGIVTLALIYLLMIVVCRLIFGKWQIKWWEN